MISPRADGSMELDLVGFTVIRCVADYAFSLELARPEAAVRGQEHASVAIEGPFEYVTDSATMRLHAEEPPETLGPALALFRRVVEEASVAQDGTLRLRYSGQMAVRAPSSPEYESWHILYGRGGRLTCMPVGDIAIRSERSDGPGAASPGGSGL
jgi:Family of unknown function (DUF6188)